MSDGGKGSAPRPVEVPRDEFNRRWEETFGKKVDRCEWCDDTGDVHSIDGEWRGVCVCDAGKDITKQRKFL